MALMQHSHTLHTHTPQHPEQQEHPTQVPQQTTKSSPQAVVAHSDMRPEHPQGPK